ncbi:hypothetical protein SDC9_134744 [bioreactor metagenome]|uniref:Uncharacterized protein n=1 Tax=bioreactor metagenome TaxID=1076179 RepID=A0A645DDZ3_9ZZZZ
MSKVCNEDCLHCPYEDCIFDEVTIEAFENLQEAHTADTYLSANQFSKKEYERDYKKAYRERHKDYNVCSSSRKCIKRAPKST